MGLEMRGLERTVDSDSVEVRVEAMSEPSVIVESLESLLREISKAFRPDLESLESVGQVEHVRLEPEELAVSLLALSLKEFVPLFRFCDEEFSGCRAAAIANGDRGHELFEDLVDHFHL